MTATPKPSPIRWISTIALCLLSLQSTRALAREGRPSVSELLEKYAQTQDSFKSFIYKADIVEKSNLSFKKGVGGGKGPKGTFTKYLDVEYRYDGERFRYICKQWGDVSTHRNIPSKSKAGYTSYLWDGNFFVRSHRHRARINTDKKKAKGDADTMAKKAFGWMHGYISGHGQRVDAFLKKHAKKAVVSKKPEIINGAKCYLVEANTPEGDIKVWFDAQHGFNVAKMEFYRRPKHKVKPARTTDLVVEIEKFIEINGVWIPIEGHSEWYALYLDGELKGDGGSGSNTMKRRDVLLNPDHDALGSFLVDDIENGCRVYFRKFTPADANDTWKDGKVVDKKGRVVLEVSRDPAPSPKAKPLKISKE